MFCYVGEMTTTIQLFSPQQEAIQTQANLQMSWYSFHRIF